MTILYIAMPVVTFVIEETPNFGKRLMVEYNGRKEFAA